MDPLHAMIALTPLAVYLLVLGWINLQLRPRVVNGMADTFALGVAICGFVIAGPMELFLPEHAANVFGWAIWPLLLLFYFSCVTLLVLLMRPRLVIYNITPEQLRSVMAEVIEHLDPDARVAGDSVFFPRLGLQLHWDAFQVFKNIQLKSVNADQNPLAWRALEQALQLGLKSVRGTVNPYGFSLLGCAGTIFCMIGYWLSYESQTITSAWSEMMRL